MPNLITGGTTITDALSTWQTPGNAFDGVTNQSFTAGAAANGGGAGPSGTNYVGKDWGSGVTKKVTQVDLYGPNNNSLMLGGGGSCTVTIDGSNDGSSWTQLDSFTTSGASAQHVTRTSSTLNVTTAYRYHRAATAGNGTNGIGIAELQFYDSNLTLTAATGSFALTGIAVALNKGKLLVAAVGSFVMTGIAVRFPNNFLSAAKGTFSLTGQTAIVRRTIGMAASVGTFVLTGRSATLFKNISLIAARGVFTYTGVTLILAKLSPGSRAIRVANFVLSKIRTTDPTLSD